MTMDELRERLAIDDDDVLAYNDTSGFRVGDISPQYQMNPEALIPWLEALLSGEYPQADSRLHLASSTDSKKEGFCCLGVLCKVAIDTGSLELDVKRTRYLDANEDAPLDVQISYDGMVAYLPSKVAQWAILAYDPKFDWRGLAGMNDNAMSFEDMAKLVWRLFGPDAPALAFDPVLNHHGTLGTLVHRGETRTIELVIDSGYRTDTVDSDAEVVPVPEEDEGSTPAE